MARENMVMLHGQLPIKPKIYFDPDGTPKKAVVAVKVLRRPFLTGSGQVVGGRLYIDCPLVVTADPDLIKIAAQLQIGDMVDVRGVLTTREVVKSSICTCGHKNSAQGNFVFITAIYLCRRETGLSADAGLELLKQRSEISNVLLMIGTLCRNPESYQSPENRVTTQYQLAVNRRYHIRDGSSERTDYPWVKSFGKQGAEDAMRLQVNSTVLINGAIQTREINRGIVCQSCGEEYEFKETVTEIFPYAVEYLTNCIFPERQKVDEEEKGGEN